eukprot:g1967.t1
MEGDHDLRVAVRLMRQESRRLDAAIAAEQWQIDTELQNTVAGMNLNQQRKRNANSQQDESARSAITMRRAGYRTGRIYRYFGLRPLRVPPPRTDWQNAREREFLKQRLHCPTKQPNGDIAYVKELTSDDLMQLRNSADNSSYNGIDKLLRLNCASGKELSKFRKKCLINKFAVSPFDTNS